VPALRACKGKGQNFTLGDVIALMALDTVTRQFGCDISLLAPGSMSLFEICGNLKLSDETAISIVFRSDTVSVISALASVTTFLAGTTPVIVVPLGPILARLRKWMSHGQLTLP